MTWGGVTCEMTWCVALRDAIDQTWLNKTRGQFTKVMVAKKLNPRSKRCDLKLQRRKRYNIEPLSMICLSYSATKAWVIFSVVFVEKKIALPVVTRTWSWVRKALPALWFHGHWKATLTVDHLNVQLSARLVLARTRVRQIVVDMIPSSLFGETRERAGNYLPTLWLSYFHLECAWCAVVSSARYVGSQLDRKQRIERFGFSLGLSKQKSNKNLRAISDNEDKAEGKSCDAIDYLNGQDDAIRGVPLIISYLASLVNLPGYGHSFLCVYAARRSRSP